MVDAMEELLDAFSDPSILNGAPNSQYGTVDKRNLKDAAYVSSALTDQDKRKTLEENIKKSLHDTLRIPTNQPAAVQQNYNHHVSMTSINTGSAGTHLPMSSTAQNALQSMRTGLGIVTPINDLKHYSYGQADGSQEAVQRCKLAALYRLVDLHGWSQSIYNHITLKVGVGSSTPPNAVASEPSQHLVNGNGVNGEDVHPVEKVKPSKTPAHGASGQFLINPFGLLYHEISASKLLLLDGGSETILDEGTSGFGFNRAGWILHSAIHRARPEIKCIIHVHTAEIVTCSINPNMLTLPLCQEACLLGNIAVHRYNGLLVDATEQKQIEQDLGKTAKVLLLENHGAVVLGRTVEETWHYLYHLMIAARTQVMIHSTNLKGSWLEQKAHKVAKLSKKTFDVVANGDTSSQGPLPIGQLNFEAQMRALDDLGYRTGYPYSNAVNRPTAFHARLAAEAQLQQALAEQRYTTEVINTTHRVKQSQNTMSTPQVWACSPNRYEKKSTKSATSLNAQTPTRNTSRSNSSSVQNLDQETQKTPSRGDKFDQAIESVRKISMPNVQVANPSVTGTLYNHVEDGGEMDANSKWHLTNHPSTNRAVMTSQGPIKIQPNHLIPANTNRQDAARAYSAITSLEEQDKRSKIVIEKTDHFTPKPTIPDRNNPFKTEI